MHQRLFIYGLIAALFCTVLPTTAQAGWFGLWDNEDENPHYHVRITTAEDTPETLKTYLETIQKNLQARPAASSEDLSYLRYRFEQDTLYLQKALDAEGYYKADLQAEFDEAAHTSNFHVTPNAPYHFGSITIITTDDYEQRTTPLKIADLTIINARTDERARAATVVEDVAILKNWIESNNCLFTYDVTHEAILNHTAKKVEITYRIMAGQEATVGQIGFEGSQTVASDYLQKKAPIKKGDCFKRSKINDAQVALQRIGLLARAVPSLPDAPDQDGSVPVTFKVSDRAQRSIKAGTSYSTDIGPGITAGWEHRNLLGHGEKLSADLSVTPIKRALNGIYEKPYFWRDDQKLKLGTELKQQDSDAFTSTGITVSGSIERDLGNGWLAGVGSKYAVTRIDDLVSEQNVALLSFPVFISQDKRDDALNPSKGWTVRADTEPFFDTIDSSTIFLKNQLQGTYYHAISAPKGSVLAMRAASGNIMGISTNAVPATERFYTGGAGSVRGYAFQEAGPLDINSDPLGGRSYVETSIEMRFRIAEDYGFVTFIDGGNTFNATYPDFEDGLRWGAGVGARYYTDFGPLRADIAFPLDKRQRDDAFQLYFSIGQAF
jgi:translocation and assembly module TamA